jgi:hypothetical protein
MTPTLPTTAPQWQEIELPFHAEHIPHAPYTEVEFSVLFTHSDGTRIRRPGFWDGGSTWRCRFASPLAEGTWQWTSHSTPPIPGLDGLSGTLESTPSSPGTSAFQNHGLLRMSPGGRSVIHADGTPFLMVADTPWALPWRATAEEVRIYADDRQRKGFNAALLMTVQPDMRATGPRDRVSDEGFDVGFDDLPQGRLTGLRPEYFQYFDQLHGILLNHGIVPVLQPVFFGYGWKGLDVAGPVVPPLEYARYCRYLVARYGARPAIYLVGADGSGEEPQVEAGGTEIEAWDDYHQPTGIHYGPNRSDRAHQAAPWLDFQWCQTGHNAEHRPEKLGFMRAQVPVKAVANGEPTYEHIGTTGKAAGAWQAHEAWANLCAGGTMGVVYGAGSLWQWKRHPDEPGHADWCTAPGAGWREALDFEGSALVGRIGHLLRNLPTTDMEPAVHLGMGHRTLLVPGKLGIVYLEHGGSLQIWKPELVPPTYQVFDPLTGGLLFSGSLDDEPLDRGASRTLSNLGAGPRVVVFAARRS